MARTRKRTRSPQTTTDQKSVETARELSVQARATQEGTWGSGGLLTYLTQAGQLVAPWWSPRRDADLDAFWKKSDHLSGALALLAARVSTVPLRVLPRDSTVKAHLRQAEDFTIRLTEESEFGQSWVDAISKWLLDFWTQDNIAAWEIIGDGKKDGPIVGAAQGLAHLDAQRLTRTGDAEFPLLYRDTDGSLSKLHRTRVAFASDMPSSRVEMRGVGFCSLSRAINVSQNLQDISIFKQEKLGSRPVRGVLLGKGIRTSVVTGSLEVADEIMDNQGLARFARLPVIGDIAVDADLSLLSLSGLPDGFDEETSTRLGMFAIALAFGVPIRWIWPAATSGATKADAMYQHIAGLGGGIGKVLNIITMLLGGDPRGSRHSAGKFLPPHLKLVFDFQDDEQDRMKADIRKVRTEARSKSLADGVINARVAREQALEEGDLSQAQFNQLELDDGRLPDSSDVLSLFTSVDDVYLRLLDLGVREPLALHANDPFIMLEEIDLAALNAQNVIGSGRTAGERQKARDALAALGKLKTIYAPEAQREAEREMQAEVTAEVQEGEEEAEVAEGEKGFASGFDYSVPVGEVIVGELARGAGGRFVNVAQLKEQLRAGILARRAAAGEAAESKPSAAAAAKAANTAAVAEALGMPPGSLDALTTLRSGGDAGDVSDLVGRGFVKLGSDGQPIITTLGRSMLAAGNSGDVDKARAAIDKDAEKKTRAEQKERERQAKQAGRDAKKREREAERERKAKEREAEREREKLEQEVRREAEAAARDIERALELESNRSEAAQVLGSRGVREADFNGLMTFRDGASLDAEMAQRLAASGLVELDPEGNPRLTQDGRAVMSAADSGDTRRVLDEMSEAREKIVATLDRAETTREKASDARDKAADYRADAEKLDADADTYEAKADGYRAEADESDAEADKLESELAELMEAGADPAVVKKAQAKADKVRERAERKHEQAADKIQQADDYDADAGELDAEANVHDAEVANLIAAGADSKDIEKAEEKATRSRERAEKKREQAEKARKMGDRYSADADKLDTETVDLDTRTADIVATGADPVAIARVQKKADAARASAERKREQAKAKDEQATRKLERAADKRKSASEKDEDATGYDEDARQLVDKVGGGATVEPVTRETMGPGGTQLEPEAAPREGGRVGPGGEAPEPEGRTIERMGPEPSGEGETIEQGLSGRVKAMVRDAVDVLLGHGEKQKVEPRGKPLKPFTDDEVPISEEDIDAAIVTWDKRMPKQARGILEARVPTAEEAAQAAMDLEAEESA